VPQDNPFYSAWAHFKVRTESVYQLSITKDGVVTTLPLYYVLAEANADRVILELNLPAATRATIPARLGDPSEWQGKVVGWPELLYQVPYIPLVEGFSGRENIAIGGKTFDCKYGSAKVAGMDLKQWFSQDVAGGLVKAEVVVDQHTKMRLLLDHVGLAKQAEPQIHLAQIMVTPHADGNVHNLKNDKAQTEEQARRKIEMLEARIHQGEDFGMLAQNYSEDPDTAANSGDLGFVPESALEGANPALGKTLAAMTPGQVTVIHTQDGYRILKVISKGPAGKR
jgi:hypothetical protein